MVPAYAPVIDLNGSPFLSTGIGRWEGNVTEFNQPDLVVFYSGDAADLPTLLRGKISLLPLVGHVNNYVLPFHQIEEVNVRQGNATITKQKVKFECRKRKCVPNEYYGLKITQRAYRKVSWEERQYFDFDPADTAYPECEMDCEARSRWVADQVNRDARPIATAVVVSRVEGATTIWGVEVELIQAGAIADFAVEGFTQPDEITPASRTSFTADSFKKWYGDKFFGTKTYADNKVFQVAEVIFWERVAKDGGIHTSSNSSGYGEYTLMKRLLAIVFDDAVTNSTNALAEFLSIANYEKPAAQYHAKVVSTTSSPAAVYPYTITRTDAGDPSAYTTARTAYNSANLLKFDRVNYDGTKSTYVLSSKSNSAPAASGSDTVLKGYYGEDNMPCLDCE